MKTTQSIWLVIGLLLITGQARANGRIEVRVDEATIQKAIDRLFAAGAIPANFGNANSEQSIELTCLAPMMRFPRREFSETQDARIILHYVCSMKSVYHHFAIICPYSERADVPSAEWDPRVADKKCPQIQVSIRPTIEKTPDGKQSVVFKKLHIDRLTLFPNEFSEEIAATSKPVIDRLLLEMNAQFEQFGNPWFRSLSPLPLKLENWTYDFKKVGQPVKTSLQLIADILKLDSNKKEIIIGARVESSSQGGSP